MNNANPRQNREIYYFAAFRLDAAERCLWRAGDPVALKPKQFDLLFYFIENAGRVIKRNELLDAVWTDTYVEENTLTRNVSWLRKLLEEAANGEKIIETVPKLGYRFAAPVTRSGRFEDEENAVIIEEQVIRQFRSEEIITIDETDAAAVEREKRAAEERKIIEPSLLQNAGLSSRSLPVSNLLLLGIIIFGLLVSGFTLYKNYLKTENRQNAMSESRGLFADTEITSQPQNVINISADDKFQFAAQTAASEKSRLTIGSIVHLQNKASGEAGYLDVWGRVADKPEFSIVATETMFVATHPNSNRDNGSGSWQIVSATGKKVGETLVYGDKIHLKSLHPDAGFLDNCGWIKHMPVYKNSLKSGKFAVFTTYSEDRDNGTGTWIIGSDVKFDGNPVLEEDEIALENGFNGGGFLNTGSSVREIQAFGDYDGGLLVFIHPSSASRRPGSGIWTISTSQIFPN